MAKSRVLIGAVVLAGGLMAGSLTASAAGIPSSFALSRDSHEVSTTLMQRTLERLGFTDVNNIQKDGRVFDADAKWKGESVNLRIDTSSNSIKRMDGVSRTASAAGIPSSFALSRDSHEVSTTLMQRTLERLGFTGVSNIQKDGRIFDVDAKWEGETVNLRIDTSSNSIKRMDGVSRTASAAGFPSSFALSRDPHEVSTTLMQQTLERLGFTSVSNIQKDGRIFEVDANWEGETVSLRIDARDSSIRRRGTN